MFHEADFLRWMMALQVPILGQPAGRPRRPQPNPPAIVKNSRFSACERPNALGAYVKSGKMPGLFRVNFLFPLVWIRMLFSGRPTILPLVGSEMP